MAISRAQKARERRQILFGGAILLVLLVVIGVTIVQVHGVFVRHVAVDPVTQCPVEGPRSVTEIVIDRTDPISDVTALDIRKSIEDELAQVPRYGAVYLYAIDAASGRGTRPLFMRCNPGRADQASSLSESRKRVDRSFHDAFQKPLNATLDGLLSNGRADMSPIIETLQAAGVTAFSGHDRADLPKRLVLVSDLLQHSERLSFYRQTPDAALTSSVATTLAAPLAGVDVRILMIRRTGEDEAKVRALGETWGRYFRQSGAGDIVATKLIGDAQ